MTTDAKDMPEEIWVGPNGQAISIGLTGLDKDLSEIATKYVRAEPTGDRAAALEALDKAVKEAEEVSSAGFAVLQKDAVETIRAALQSEAVELRRDERTNQDKAREALEEISLTVDPDLHRRRVMKWFFKYQETIRAALAGPKIDWELIDTAPKDGTRVLIWREDFNKPLIGFCTDITYTEGDKDKTRRAFVWDCDATRFDEYDDLDPTHWAPLPEPPVREKLGD